MTRRRWAIAGTVYLVAQLVAIPLLPVLLALAAQKVEELSRILAAVP